VGTWLNGIGLACGFAGAVLMFFFGVPRYSHAAREGHSFFLLEEDDPALMKAARRADLLSKAGMLLLAAGFVLQFVALVCCDN
jgi:hypothetical protein